MWILGVILLAILLKMFTGFHMYYKPFMRSRKITPVFYCGRYVWHSRMSVRQMWLPLVNINNPWFGITFHYFYFKFGQQSIQGFIHEWEIIHRGLPQMEIIENTTVPWEPPWPKLIVTEFTAKGGFSGGRAMGSASPSSNTLESVSSSTTSIEGVPHIDDVD
jgi:hypothetical protein